MSFSQEYSQRKDRHLLMREAAAADGECSWQGRMKTSELSAHTNSPIPYSLGSYGSQLKFIKENMDGSKRRQPFSI